jgi:hypothetical protein
LEEGAQNRGPSWGAATSSLRGAIPMSGMDRRSGSGPVVPQNPSSFLTMSGEQSWDELRECAEGAMGSLWSTMEVLSRNVPRILQVRISGIPFA